MPWRFIGISTYPYPAGLVTFDQDSTNKKTYAQRDGVGPTMTL